MTSAGEGCLHLRQTEGQCDDCGHCTHEIVLNGACFRCGSEDLDGEALSPKRPAVIPAAALVRGKAKRAP